MKSGDQLSFDHFCPKIKPGRILPQGSKIIYETSEPFNQIILPIELADLLVLCTGRFTMREVIEKIYKRQGVVHFKSVFTAIYRLKDRGFLENGNELIDSPTRTHLTEPHQSVFLRPLIEIFFGQRISNDKTHPLMFYFLSMAMIILALLGIQNVPGELFATKFLRINGSYALGVLYFIGLSSILLSLKSLFKAIMLLFLTGRVYNFRLVFNLFGIHFKVGNESLFLLFNKLYLTIFHLSLALSHFVFVSVLYWLLPDLPLYDQSLYIAVVLTLIDLNPFTESEFSLYFKALCEDDGLNQLTAYIPNKNLLSVLTPTGNTRYQGVVLAFWHMAGLWIVAATYILHQMNKHNSALIRFSLEADPHAEKIAALVLAGLYLTAIIVVLQDMFQVIQPIVSRPIKNRYHRLLRRLRSINSSDFTPESLLFSVRDLPLFSYFSDPLLQKVIQQSQVRSFPAGTRVIIQGDVGRHMYVLMRGALAVRRAVPRGFEKIGEVLPVSIFGEVAVIEEVRRTAEVVTEEASVVLEIPAQVIREASAESQYIREIEDFKNAIMVSQYFTSAPMFRNLPEDIVQLFLSHGKIEPAREGEIIFHQGSRGDGFYLLIRGSVGVSINGAQVKKIHQGGFFGEISVIADIPRTGTVTALENTLLLRITNDAFWDIVTQNIEMAMFIESVSEMRIVEDIELLNRGIPPAGTGRRVSFGLNSLLLQDSTSTKALFFLALAFVFCFLSRKHLYWFACTSIFVVLGVMAGRITWPGVLVLSVTGGILAAYHFKKDLPHWQRLGFVLLTLASGLGLFLHVFPGFNNWHVGVDSVKGSGVPFQIYLNFDKPFFGVVFFALSAEAVRSRKSWGQVLKAVSMVLPLAVATVLGGALVLGWLSLQSTPLPDWTAIWIFKNLFLTVIAEEALFRGLIQRELKERLPHKWSRLSLPLSALLFGLAHFSGGGRYIAAASLAGVFYGWAWERSGGRLEAAILCHFGLNLCHFFFLTYPQ